MPRPVTKANQKKIKDWLKGKGHSTAKVDALKWDDDTDVKRSILALHGMDAQYRVQG